jgi:L-alanine-DL-glutamate epimerase-like enolase superfamily enzyme
MLPWAAVSNGIIRRDELDHVEHALARDIQTIDKEVSSALADIARVTRLEWARLEGQRPRYAGSNARLGDHGLTVRPPVLRVTLDDGSSGFGPSNVSREQAADLLGQPMDVLFVPEIGATGPGLLADFALWDLAAKRAGLPVYALAARGTSARVDAPFRVPCYDTSLYFDDLHLSSKEEAAALIAAEARSGYERGHRAFKIKVGRGARHLPLEEGTQRDIAVIRAVREAVGPKPPLLIDANNGYNLNLTKRVLAETAACRLYWLEEPFHEDGVLYRALKEWLAKEGLSILIADGEGQASPSLLAWAKDGLIDAVQYDILGYGFTRWLATGRQLDEIGVWSAPHHYGGHVGNYTSGHLAGVLHHFAMVEWDEATTPGLDASGYTLQDGRVALPNTPGFGLHLDEAIFRQIVTTSGWELSEQ